MYGALYVVEDLDEYRADPEAYLAKHPLTIADELLKFTGPRKEWKFDDLAPLAEKLESGRSYANGKHLFTVATCIACHKLNGVGNEFGPDLTKMDPKRQGPRRGAARHRRAVVPHQREVPDVDFHAQERQRDEGPDPGGDGRRRQGDRKPAGQVRADDCEEVDMDEKKASKSR